MKVPYIVKHSRIYYPANTELSEEVAETLEESEKKRIEFERKFKKEKLENVTVINMSTFK